MKNKFSFSKKQLKDIKYEFIKTAYIINFEFFIFAIFKLNLMYNCKVVINYNSYLTFEVRG